MLHLTRKIVDIAITCSDFEKSLAFYRDILGLEVVMEIEIDGDLPVKSGLAPRPFRQTRLQAGETLIKLMQIESPPATTSKDFKAGVRWLTFFVEDLDATYRELVDKGAEFLAAPLSAPDAAGVACALDPDGVLIELVQI